MKIELATKQRIVKNAILSLFIFILPIALMFVTFYFTGERPWEKKQQQHKQNSTTVNKTNNVNNNGSND